MRNLFQADQLRRFVRKTFCQDRLRLFFRIYLPTASRSFPVTFGNFWYFLALSGNVWYVRLFLVLFCSF